MKTLVIVEHNNDSIKQTTYSTITAASKISDEVYALILGHDLSTAVDLSLIHISEPTRP